VAVFPNGKLYRLYHFEAFTYHLASDVKVSATSCKIPYLRVPIPNLERSCWHVRMTITRWKTFCGCLGKVLSRTDHEGTHGSRFIALLIHNICSRNGLVFKATPRTLPPRKISGTRCIRGWVCLWAGLNEYGKSRTRIIQPVASRYNYSCCIYRSKRKPWWTKTS
jgi:hypothetical protein